MNTNLTARVKECALGVGADLVGISPISRFEGAPIMMSPKGILPTAKSVVVCAIHHLDEAIELGGEEHPQIIGPYSIQYVMNLKLDYIAFRVARYLDDLGYEAVPIAASNIWRYRPFGDMTATFAPDMSHIYAATCAGLGQLGWHGLTMSPEYGPRNRFISIITNAPLCPTPLYDESKLCDMCGECIKHCPTDAYRKECNGTKSITVEGKEFKFANKNLWRCAWAEHFDLDLDLEIPDVVDEKVILENIDKYGMRGGEMGCCVKFCLPKHLRSDGGTHTSAPQRLKHSVANPALPVHRRLYDEVVNFVGKYSIDNVVFLDEKTVDTLGGKQAYEYARGAVVMTISCKKSAGAQGDKINARNGYGNESFGTISAEQTALAHFSGFARLDAARIIDDYGYKTLNSPEVDKAAYLKAAGIQKQDDEVTVTEILLTNAPFASCEYYDLNQPIEHQKRSLTQNLCDLMESEGSDLYAVVPAERMDALSKKLIPIKGGEALIDMASKTPRFHLFEPNSKSYARRIYKTKDHLEGAKNVILMGMHYPEIVQKMTIKPPAFAVGPYMYSKYETTFELAYSSFKVIKYLQGKGYKAIATYNLTGIGGDMGTPRGELPDAFCNQLEAVEAGLGQLTVNGMCYTAEHGFSQDFIAIVTDAPLDEVVKARGAEHTACCENCDACIKACPANALRAENAVRIELNGTNYKWIPTNGKACDWSKRYALCGEEGHKYTGSDTNFDVPKEITEENLADAMKKADRILSYRPTTVHRCVIECPLVQR
ncbi:MAG: 4Fe-4S binding protein [Clostridia bacterium]|nr:4Fe-4S binding protein [Clostridia bacterium]